MTLTPMLLRRLKTIMNTSAPMNPMQMLNALKSDPVSVLRSRGLNIPDGMNNPNQIIQHLLQSGQVPQARYQQAMQMMHGMKR